MFWIIFADQIVDNILKATNTSSAVKFHVTLSAI